MTDSVPENRPDVAELLRMFYKIDQRECVFTGMQAALPGPLVSLTLQFDLIATGRDYRGPPIEPSTPRIGGDRD